MSHFIDHIAPLFEKYPLIKWQENTYIIENSADLSREAITKLVNSKHFCPIFSDSRILSNLVFTIVPFKKYETLNCRKNEITQEELWNSIESTSSQFKAEEPIIIQEQKLCEKAWHKQQEMFLACNKIASLMVDFIHDSPLQGKLLDLGCGPGANSIPLLKKGWDVDAMDISGDLLEVYKKQAQQCGILGQLRLSQGDITVKEFERNCYDAVICYDTLPYIDSKKIQSLMKKICDALKPNGKFFGTIFIQNEDARFQQEYLEKLGAHFYKGQHIVPNLLNYTGFDTTLCSFRLEGKIDSYRAPIAIEYIGTKK